MSTDSGRAAETYAAAYLAARGFEILDRNWRTRFCEIDIVAQKTGRIHFIEVKYRSHDRQGGGLDYITPLKQAQLVKSALYWVSDHAWEGDYQIDALAVTGLAPDFKVKYVASITG